MILAAKEETGKLQIMHLKRYWSKLIAGRSGQLPQDSLQEEWKTDVTLLSALGLGIEQTVKYVYSEAPDFPSFEDWILNMNGGQISAEKVQLFNRILVADHDAGNANTEQVLSAADMAFWEEHGYVILRNAVAKEDCDNTVALICRHLGIERDNPATWYTPHKDRQGIMVQLFQHAQLQKNRDTKIIRLAYEQLWGRKDIWVNADRVGFNPPETETYKFQGPRLHWDVSLELPIPFGLQGILYLADTAANQGAFTLVPGFQHRIAQWLTNLPVDANPRTQDIYALGTLPVAANAGDFIIWHHALPHGSSPNTATKPRFVQYINYEPINPVVKTNWK